MEFRAYRQEDYEAVCRFLIELNQKDNNHINWNWARFEWMAEHPEFDKSLSSFIGLWTDEGKIVGAAIYGSEAGTWIDFITLIINKKITAADLKSMIFAFPTNTYMLVNSLLPHLKSDI